MMKRGVTFLVLAMFIVSLVSAVNITPTAATTSATYTWNSADNTHTSTSNPQVNNQPLYGYATTSPMEALAWSMTTGASGNVGGTESGFDYYFTATSRMVGVQITANAAELSYILGNNIPYYCRADVSVRVYIYTNPEGFSHVYSCDLYSDSFTTGNIITNPEKQVTLQGVTWQYSDNNLNIPAGNYILQVEIYAFTYGMAEGAYPYVVGNHLLSQDDHNASYLKLNSVSFTLTMSPPPSFTSVPDTAQCYQQTFSQNKYLYWTGASESPASYVVTGGRLPVSGGWSGGQVSCQIDNMQLKQPGTYTYTCYLYDTYGACTSNTATVYVQDPTLNSVTIINPPDQTWFITSGSSMNIGFMVDINAFPYDPGLTTRNTVEFTRDNGWTWSTATWLSSSGTHNYYTWSSNFASGYPTNGASNSYTIQARVTVWGFWGTYSMSSQKVTIHVQYNAGGGGGGCPYLWVYDGSQYVNEGLLDIHTGYNGTDLITTRVLNPSPVSVDGKYLFKLVEHPNTTSHIDQVKLCATLSNGKSILLPLVSAIHSDYGNVLPQLLRSDDWRVDENGAKFNNGVSQSIDLKFLALPSSIHVVSFTFVIEGYNPFPTY